MSLLLFLQTAGLILVPYLFCVVFYRLYLHPLRGFPGPWLAAATGYYQTYYEVWRDGEFVPHVKELHRIYGLFCLLKYPIQAHIDIYLGPIIRVSPNEVTYPYFGYRKVPKRNWTGSSTSAIQQHTPQYTPQTPT